MHSCISGIASARLKLARIAEHLEEINGILKSLASTEGAYEIFTDADGKEKLHFLVDAPVSVQIIAGEIIYQFKSALDHIAFDLVQSNPSGGVLPNNWERGCQFPLCLTVPTRGNSKVPYGLPVPHAFFSENLPGLSKSAYAFIEALQPYYSGPGPHNILRIIGKLANIDKHRHLYVLLSRASVRFDFAYSDGRLVSSSLGGLKQGAEIPSLSNISNATTPMNVQRSFTPYITFDETVGIGPDTLGTENLLEVCLKEFETFFHPGI